MAGARILRLAFGALVLGVGAAAAQAPSTEQTPPGGQAPPAVQVPPAEQAPAAAAAAKASAAEQEEGSSLALHFDLGSATLRPQDEELLDQATQLYRDALPTVMVLTGSTDTLGRPERNLLLSQARTNAVLRGLARRGIPAERFLLVAKGEADPLVATPDGVDEWRNRRVEITWR